MEFSDAKAGQPTVYWKAASSGQVVNGESIVRTYPSGEPLIDIPRGYKIFGVMVKPRSVLELMAALWFVDAAKERGADKIDLILPFVPGSRQDRINDQGRGDYLFTAKSVAKEINLRGFKTVTILDPHSDVMPALISRCKVKTVADCFKYGGYSGVISPDAGAEKRASLIAKKECVPLYHGWKSRNTTTGEITEFGCEAIHADGRFLVVDDICDGGGTFVGLAENVRRARAIPLDLYVTHGLFSKGLTELKRHYQNVFCTDSVDVDRNGVEVLPVCKDLFRRL